jgi:hypothetical protein
MSITERDITCLLLCTYIIKDSEPVYDLPLDIF